MALSLLNIAKLPSTEKESQGCTLIAAVSLDTKNFKSTPKGKVESKGLLQHAVRGTERHNMVDFKDK